MVVRIIPECQRLPLPGGTQHRTISPLRSRPRLRPSLCCRGIVYDRVGPLAPLGVPVWKPFLKRRATPPRCRMRPVPSVLLRLAFSLQLSIPSHSCQYTCSGFIRSQLTIRGRSISARARRQAGACGRTLPHRSSRVAARGTGVLLDVERAAAWVIQGQSFCSSCWLGSSSHILLSLPPFSSTLVAEIPPLSCAPA